jgi:Protein of unknown function (DUF4079)
MDKEILAYLRLVHALFNLTVFLFFLVQAWIGLKIRHQRIKGMPPKVKAVKLHRQAGPILAILGVSGFVAGLTIGYLDHGIALKYPLHLTMGSIIAASILLILATSKKIRSRQSSWRSVHSLLGLWLLCLYGMQILTGLGILL